MSKRRSRAAAEEPAPAEPPLRSSRPQLAVPGLAVALGCLPLIAGFPQGHDWIYELVRIAEYGAAWSAGQWPPYWGENLYAGYGSPAYLYYAPFFSAASALMAAPLQSPTAGAVALLVALSVIGAVAVYGMARAATASALAARVAVVVYALHPYLLADKFVRNADAEFAALCFVPLPIWGVLIARERPRAGFVLVSLGLALCVLAHNLTALVAVGLVGIGALVVFGPVRELRAGAVVVSAVVVALGLTAFFWVPAFFLTDLVQTDQLLSGKFDFRRQWPALADVFGYGRFFGTGWVTPAVWLAGVAIAVAWRDRLGQHPRVSVAALVAAAGFVFLMMPASRFVWESIPLLPLFQFPWRWIGPLALVTALTAAFVALAVWRVSGGGSTRAVEVALLVACAANAYPVIASVKPLAPDVRERLPMLLAPASIRVGSQNVTVLDEYLPIGASADVWRTQRPVAGPLISRSGLDDLEVSRDRGSHMQLVVTAGAPTRLRFARWAFPGWVARVDGKRIDVETSAVGTVELAIPAGVSEIELVLEPPPLRRAGLWCSAFALALWTATTAWLSRSRRNDAVSPPV